jgi:hypothetical protein
MKNMLNIIAASRRRVTAFDADAAAYFARIVSAGSSISAHNKNAVNAFVVGCKADGIWSAIKASCFLAGPDDLTGALVPLVGAAPTNFNFAAGDYNRVTGLVGNGLTKYLNSNRAGNADPRNNQHLGVYLISVGTLTQRVLSNGGDETGTSSLAIRIGEPSISRSQSTTAGNHTSNITEGFFGVSRSSSTSYFHRNASANVTHTISSQTPRSNNIDVFRGAGAQVLYADARLSFYSIGESLDLALLDARLTTYMSAIT